MSKLRVTLAAAVVVTAITVGVAYENPASTKNGEVSTNHAGHNTPAASDDPVIRAYQETNNKMHADMAINFTGDADVDFMRGMIPHHQGAIDMAKVVLKYGKNPEVRKLAENVIAAQEDEIKMMHEWLAKKNGK